MLGNGVGQRLQRLGVKGAPGLLGIGLYFLQRQDSDLLLGCGYGKIVDQGAQSAPQTLLLTGHIYLPFLINSSATARYAAAPRELRS